MELLRCEHLSKIYGEGNNAVKALDDVSFSVEKGEFVSIVGLSGSGKSTLIHILGGVDKPTAGTVYIGDTDIHTLSADKLAIFRCRQIGLVCQFYNLLPVLNVDENIVLPHLLDGRKMNQERLDLVVDQMGLRDRRNNLQTQLSGEQQRVSIGRIAVEQLFHFLESAEHLPIGVYITSPNYLEEIADIAGLAFVCKQFGIPLIVDNSHGAYLKFLHTEKHPLQAGAALMLQAVGYSGIETAKEMRAYRMECEYADEQYVVLMMNIEKQNGYADSGGCFWGQRDGLCGGCRRSDLCGRNDCMSAGSAYCHQRRKEYRGNGCFVSEISDLAGGGVGY